MTSEHTVRPAQRSDIPEQFLSNCRLVDAERR